MGRKTRKQIYDEDSDYSSDEEDEDYLNQIEILELEKEDINKINNFIDFFEHFFSIPGNCYFDHLKLLGSNYVYNTIINQIRPETNLYIFPQLQENKLIQMDDGEYYFWVEIHKILDLPIENIEKIHNLLSG